MIRVACVLLLASAAFASDAFERAKESFVAGDLPAALVAAGEVDPRDDRYAKARYLAGEIQLTLGDAEAAATAFREGLKAKPAAEPILTGLGRALIESDVADEAIEVLRKAVAADPKSGRAICFLGIARLKDSGGTKGRAEIEKGAKLAKADPEVARAVVLAYLDEAKDERALKAARRFAKARREHPMGPFLEALVLERSEEFDDAIAAYEKSIALDAKFLDAHKNLAILCITQNPMYTNQKRTGMAMRHFDQYFALGGKDERVKQVYATLQQFLKSR